MAPLAMEEPLVSLSRTAQGVFQTESYSEASWTSRSGRCVRISGACKNGAEHKAPTYNARRGATPEAKVADAHEPRLLDNLRKLAVPPIDKPKATSDTEPDEEPVSFSDSPVAQVPSESHGTDERHQAEVRSLTAQLMDAKEQAERLKASQEKQFAEAAAERERRKEVEDKSARLLLKCQSHEQTIFKIKKDKAKEHAKLEAEKAGLERKLQQLHRNPRMAGAKSGSGNDNLATHTAGVECRPLKHCSAEEKAALKKKLLLKWHPDKQPSADHSSFATSVMQEMQNCAEWRD